MARAGVDHPDQAAGQLQVAVFAHGTGVAELHQPSGSTRSGEANSDY
ncbi:hypothetical protein [Kribbella sp. NPDC049227]